MQTIPLNMCENEQYSLYSERSHSFNRIAITIWNGLMIAAIFLSIFTFIYNKSEHMVSNLFLLPMSYLLSLLLMRKTFRKQPGMALIIIEVVMGCRFLIIPFMWSMTSDYTGVSISLAFNKAVWYMVYEELAVSAAMWCWSSVKHKDQPVNLDHSQEKKMLRPLTVLIIAFWFFIIFVNSKLRGYLLNFTLLTSEQMGFTKYVSMSEYLSDIPGIFRVFYYIGLTTLFTCLVRLIAGRKWYRPIKIILVGIVCVCFISSMWSSGYSVSRWGLMVSTVMSVYVLLFCFPSHKKMIITIGIVGVVFVVLVGSALKTVSIQASSEATIGGALEKYLNPEMFDEYFQGIGPVANGIKVAEDNVGERGIEGILVDTCFNFPYAMKILGLSNAEIATVYFHQATGHYDLIMPTVTQSIMQFGKLFAPLYSVICVLLALWFDRKQQASRTLHKKLFFTVLVFWTSLFMAVSTNVIEANIWYAVIAIWIFTFEDKLKITL